MVRLRSLAGIVIFIVVALAGPAAAQPPLLELSQQVVQAGTLVSATVIGPPFHFFGVASSSANDGLGGGLELGPDITIIGSGQLDASGRGTFFFTVPASPSPLYVQGATSPDPGFSVFTPTTAKTITGGVTSFAGTIGIFGGTNSLYAAVNEVAGTSVSEADVQTLVLRSCDLTKLRARTALPLVQGQTVVTLRVNGGIEALTCTLIAGASSCTSGTASHPVIEGDLLAMRAVYTSSLPATHVYFGFLCN